MARPSSRSDKSSFLLAPPGGAALALGLQLMEVLVQESVQTQKLRPRQSQVQSRADCFQNQTNKGNIQPRFKYRLGLRSLVLLFPEELLWPRTIRTGGTALQLDCFRVHCTWANLHPAAPHLVPVLLGRARPSVGLHSRNLPAPSDARLLLRCSVQLDQHHQARESGCRRTLELLHAKRPYNVELKLRGCPLRLETPGAGPVLRPGQNPLEATNPGS